MQSCLLQSLGIGQWSKASLQKSNLMDVHDFLNNCLILLNVARPHPVQEKKTSDGLRKFQADLVGTENKRLSCCEAHPAMKHSKAQRQQFKTLQYTQNTDLLLASQLYTGLL